MKSIITLLLGGLGNQMFQYAVGRSLSLKYGVPLKVDTSILLDHRPGVHAVNREYDLDIFNLQVDAATWNERLRYNAHSLSLPLKAVNRIANQVLGDRVRREPSFGFDMKLLIEAACPRYISGLWQSPRYFEDIKDQIKEDFTFKSILPNELCNLGARISRKNSVCLHVRRGDYVSVKSNNETIGFIGKNYYREALLQLRRQTDIAHIFVFSDDIEWCRRELHWIEYETTYVEHFTPGKRHAVDLHLMTMANHYIIPNSTFSWWGAWLSPQKQKCVIAPRDWFKDRSLDTSDLCPLDWIRI